MPAKLNLTGQKFGKLTAIREVSKEERKGKLVTWECQCDCGNRVLVTTHALRNGSTQSCGCLYSKNLIGQKFERLTVLSATDMRKHGSMVWKCQCDCGKFCYATSEGLRTGDNKSCGCLKAEQAQVLANKSKLRLEGKKFGKLTVLKVTEQRTKQQTQIWECQCDCGNLAYVSSGHLTSGNTKSCGCLQGNSYGELRIKELLKEHNINYKSEYIFSDLSHRRYDFAIFNQQGMVIQLIEFDGEQHYIDSAFFGTSLKEQQKIDQEKTDFAKQQGIKLIRIPYWKRDTLTFEDLEINTNEL